MTQSIRDVMTSSPCTIDADKSVAYAARMMLEEDVGLAPIVEGEKLVGMLTDRDIAVRVAAQGRDPDQVKVIDVASKKLVTIDPEQDLDEVLRIMAQHQVRRLPVVEEDGRLIGVVAQADIAREGDDSTTGQLVQEISDSGGQMSSMEGQFESSLVGQVEEQVEPVAPVAQPETVEEEEVSRVQAASARPRRRSTRKRTTTARKKSTGGRKKSSGGRKKKAATSRKRSTAKRGTAKRGTAKRKTTSRKRSTAAKRGAAKRKTTTRKRSTAAKRGAAKRRTAAKRGAAKRKTTSRKRSTAAKRGAAKRKTTTRKRSATKKRSTAKRSTAKRKTTSRKRSTAKRSTAKRSTAKRSTAKRSTAKRSTAKRRTTRRRTSR